MKPTFNFRQAAGWLVVLIVLLILGNTCLAQTHGGTVMAWGRWDYGETNVPSTLTNAVAIAGGAYHSLAITGDHSLVGWGDGWYDDTNAPAGLTNPIAVAGGYSTSVALQSDTTVIGWGSSSYGIIQVPTGLSNVVAIADGGLHVLALKRDGTVVAWGSNDQGDTDVPAGLNHVVAIAAGLYHSLALKNDGTVVAWGGNAYGQTSIPAGLTNVVAISASVGGHGCLALKRDESLVAWGDNSQGQTNIPAGLSNVVFIASGSSHNLALVSDGTIRAWGYNDYGEGTAPANLSNVVSVAAGYQHSLVIVGDGTTSFVHQPLDQLVYSGNTAMLSADVACNPPFTYQWLFDGYPILGATQNILKITNAQATNSGSYSLVVSNADGGVIQSRSAELIVVEQPPFFVTQPTNAVALAGTNVLFSTIADGSPTINFQWCFNGNPIPFATNHTLTLTNIQADNAGNYRAQISNIFGTNLSENVSLTVSPSAPTIVSYSTNQRALPQSDTTLFVAVNGSMPFSYQWTFSGTNLPNATNATLFLSNAQASDGGIYGFITTNSYGSVFRSNIVVTIASVVAWGVNNYGQATVPYNLGSATAVAGSQYNSFAVLTNGTVAGWGLGSFGATNFPPDLINVVQAVFGNSLGLAVRDDGTVGWWGTSTQTNLIPSLSNVVAVAASQGNFYLALQSNGVVTAWGANGYGQTNVPAGLSNVAAITTGDYHSMALKNDGTVAVWGGNVKGTYGQTNIPAGLSNVVSIAGGYNFSLAVKSDGSVVGWPTNEPNVVMRIPAGLSNAVSVTADYQHALALTKDGIVWEWGTVGTGYLTNQIAFSNAIGTAVACGYYHSLANLGSGSPIVIQQPWNQVYYGGNSTFMYAGIVGSPPTTYQWQLNGTNVNGATNLLLKLNNITPANAGVYSLTASNALGIAVSSNATLTVVTYPPVFTLQPTNQTVIAGSNVTFSVAVGPGPIPNTLQWQFNSTNIVGATNLSLSLTNVQTTDQGNYAVVVNNGYGTTTSSNAYLTVIVIDLPTALNTPGWTWTNSGSTAWYAQTNTTHDGFEAAQSGLVANGQSSTLQTTVTGPGTLTFWWMFSPLTSPFPNTLSFSSSLGNASTSVNSTTGWQQKTIYLGAGQQTLNWNYSRYSIFSAQSTGWVDQVSFTPGGTLPTLTSMSPNAFVRAGANVTFSVGAYGTPPLSCQWQLNGTNLLNKTNTFLNLTGAQVTNTGLYSVMITNSFGSATTNAALWVGQFALNSSATNFVFSTNGLQLKLDGILTTNPVVIFGSTDLVSWLPLFTNSATTGSIQFLDVAATNLPTRFYRAQE